MLHLGTKLEVKKPTEVIQQEERSEVKKREVPEAEAREVNKGEYKLLPGGGTGSKGKDGHRLWM